MLLSIVIPTLNRADLLQGTLRHLGREVALLPSSSRDRMEVVVVDNASGDATAPMLQAWSEPYFRMVRHEDCAPIGRSIARAIGEARGEFVWVMGDDDYFTPGLLVAVFAWLGKASGIAMVYFNRAILDWTFTHHQRVAHAHWAELEHELPMGEFIRRYSHWPGFITAMIFRRQAYIDGASFDKPAFEAWEFLARIYLGGREGRVRVFNFPVVGQRLGVHAWKANWPRYWLVNMPRMLRALEDEKVTVGAVAQWREVEISAKRLFIDTLVAKAFGTGCMDSFWREAAVYQPGWRAWLLAGVRWMLPCCVARLAYRLQPKYRR